MAVLRHGLARALATIVLLAGGVAALASAPAAARAVAPVPISGGSPARSTIAHLSSRLAALAANPVTSRGGQARVTGTPAEGAGSLQREPGTNRLLVDVRLARVDAAARDRLRAAGAVITHQATYVRTVTVAVAPTALRALARTRGVRFVSEILKPIAGAVCDQTKSEGDQILHAVQERTNHSVDGTGVTVGVISDSYDTTAAAPTHAADDVASDDLPGTTNTCNHLNAVAAQDYNGGGQTDEGRAMAQIVHDVAPGAKIMFATGEATDTAMADNIRALANAGANIIVDDLTYFAEPVYQDGVIAKAVSDVRAMGVDYFSDAANNNIIVGGHDVASYEAVGGYRPTTCPAVITAFNANYTDCHSFTTVPAAADPTYGLTTIAGRSMRIALDWAEPQFGVRTDYALCVLNPGGSLAFCQDNRNPGTLGSQQAVEVAGFTTGTALSVVVARYSGNNPNTNGTPRFKLTFLTNGNGAVTGSEYTTATGSDVIGPAIFGHNGGTDSMSVAASDVRVIPSTVETYSSHGPVTLLFGPVDGTTPATALASPLVLAKPDVTASDCAINTFFGFNDGTHWRFCGTSAAAPHAAAVAALLLQQNPDLTPAQINAALRSTADTLSLPASTQGAGLVDAAAAGDAVVPKGQTITFTQPASGAVGGIRSLPASASSHLPVKLTVDAATVPIGACTLTGSTVHYVKAGSCVVDANQAGNALFHAAPQVKRTITIKAAPKVTTLSLPKGVVGKKYAATLHSSGGNAPLTWSRRSGSLPSGLRLSSSGAITGTPTKAGSFKIAIAVTDSSAPRGSATRTFTITVAPIAVRTTALPKGTVARKYAATLRAYGGKTPLSWKVTFGSLPRGLSLARSGAISGRPTKAGTFRFTVRVTDAAGHRASATLTIVVRRA